MIPQFDWIFYPQLFDLIGREEIDVWMNAPAEEALKLQRPLPDNSLTIVARGDKKDEGGLAA